MVFDWFTFVAQIINFVILVYLLWRFLYKPITKTMAKRKQQLNERWQNARKKQEEAEAKANSFYQKKQDLEQREAEIMAEAQDKAEEERKAKLRQARAEINQKQEQWQQAIQRQQDSFLMQLREKMQDETFLISRRALQDLADVELEQQAIAIFIKRLQQLENEHDRTANEITIRSSFEIPSEQRQQIEQSLKNQGIAERQEIHYTTSDDLICGIELQLDYQKISWNLNNYLQDLKTCFSDTFEQRKAQTNEQTPEKAAPAAEFSNSPQ
ncbi:MAG: F0F1 ATP synthase subunit B [Spirulinaceae cyanobacterium]